MKPDSDAFNFYLIYATRHPKGVQAFKDAERRTEKQTHVVRAGAQQRQRQQKSGNLELFAPQVLYRETKKYQQLAEDNRERAKKRIWDLLSGSREISYDDCWAEALQFPAVYQSDLRDWLTEWEKAGRLHVKGRKRLSEVLKRDCGHSLRLSPETQ
jgi:hypothetical protein